MTSGHTRVRWVAACTCALVVAAVPMTATSAGAAPAPAGTPSATAAAKSRLVAAVDIDGDGRKDRVGLRRISVGDPSRYSLTVRTARGVSSTVKFSSDWSWVDDPGPAIGVGIIDGVRGAELAVPLWTSGGDSLPHSVLTWRRGRLVNLRAPLPAPGSPITGDSGSWGVLAVEWGVYGYSFGHSKGVRTATVASLTREDSGLWKGRTARSVWTTKGWKMVATRRVTLTEKVAFSLAGMRGITYR